MLDQNAVRQMDTEAISGMLRGSRLQAMDKLILCNELLARKVSITALHTPFESLFRTLSVKDLRHIEQYDFQFEKAVVHGAILEMRYRKLPIPAWFIQTGEERRRGPMDLFDLEKQLAGSDGSTLIWKEGWKEWRSLSSLPWINKEYFFDQTLASRADYVSQPKPGDNSRKTASVGLLIAGIMQLPGLIFWMFWSVIGPFIGFYSFTGPILPLMFSIFMALLSVPLGIGLIIGARWASQIKLGTSVITLLWFLSMIVIDDFSPILIILITFELIMFILVATNFDWQRHHENP